MLANYLKSMRAAKVLQPAAAAATLGNGWQVTSCGNGLEKKYQFHDFIEASNFIQRYTEHCQKVNQEPQWSNVYNNVSVTLANAEFKAVTMKEVSIGQHLDMQSRLHLEGADVDAVLSFDQIVGLARIEPPVARNAQDHPTSLFPEDDGL